MLDAYMDTMAAVSRALAHWPFPEDDFEPKRDFKLLQEWIGGDVKRVVDCARWGLLGKIIFAGKAHPAFCTVKRTDEVRGRFGVLVYPMRALWPGIAEHRNTLQAVWILSVRLAPDVDEQTRTQISEWVRELTEIMEERPRYVARDIQQAMEWLAKDLPDYVSALRQAAERRPDREVARELSDMKNIMKTFGASKDEQIGDGKPFWKPKHFADTWRLESENLRRHRIESTEFTLGKVRCTNKQADPDKRAVYWYSEPDARRIWSHKFVKGEAEAACKR